MNRTVELTPAMSDWIAYQIDQRNHVTGKWECVAARPRPKDQKPGSFSTTADFDQHSRAFRVVWVGPGGSKNMLIGDAQTFDAPEEAAPAATYGGAR